MSQSDLRKHLVDLGQEDLLPMNHVQYLWKLKREGFEPRVIYDLGACVLHWTHVAQKVWPQAQFILFDAFQPAEFLYEGYDYHLGVLSDQDHRQVDFYQNNYWPGGNSYYREVGHPHSAITFGEEHRLSRVTRSLDSVVAERGFPLPDLVKMDVQGSERDILAGAQQTLKSCSRLIVELQTWEYNQGAPCAHETLPYIESLGFTCTDPLFQNNGADGDYGFVRTSP